MNAVEETRKLQRARVQLILGVLQIAGASFTMWFLLTTGASRYTIGGVMVTGVLTLTSLALRRFWNARARK